MAIGRSGEKYEGRVITIAEVKEDLLKDKSISAPSNGKAGTVISSNSRTRTQNISQKPEGCNVVFIAGTFSSVASCMG